MQKVRAAGNCMCLLSPILHVVPLQLLAYHTALARGTDVEKPRNFWLSRLRLSKLVCFNR